MSRKDAIIIDIGDLVRTVKREASVKIHPEIFESWFAKCYTKAHGIPCVSANIVTSRTDDDVRDRFVDMRDELMRIVTKHRFDPLLILPQVPWRQEPHASIWMYVKNDHLLMGTSRAIKSCWGDLYHRFS